MNIKELHEKMLYPIVRVRTVKAGGSGTVIYSQHKEDNPNEFDTYVLTNYHVIADAIQIKKVWDAKIGRDLKKEFRQTVEVEFFEYKYLSECIGGLAVEADIECWDDLEDLALLKLRTVKEAPAIATLYPIRKDKDIKMFMETVAAGCSLGHSPIETKGIITSLSDEIEHKKYWMSTAQTIFGNSGGAIYLEKTGQFIGVPARITTIQLGFGVDVITHMGYFVPIKRIYEFLDNQTFQFIFDTTYTGKQCAESRKKQREEEERKRILSPVEVEEKEE